MFVFNEETRRLERIFETDRFNNLIECIFQYSSFDRLNNWTERIKRTKDGTTIEIVNRIIKYF